MFKTLALEISSTALSFTDNLRAACSSSTFSGTSLPPPPPLHTEIYKFDFIIPPLADVDRPPRQYINCSPPHDMSNMTVSVFSLMLAWTFLLSVYTAVFTVLNRTKRKRHSIGLNTYSLNGLKGSEKIAMLSREMLRRLLARVCFRNLLCPSSSDQCRHG